MDARVHLEGTNDLLLGPPHTLTQKGGNLLPLLFIMKTLKHWDPFGLLRQPGRESQLIKEPVPLLQLPSLSTTICRSWQNGLQATLTLNKGEDRVGAGAGAGAPKRSKKNKKPVSLFNSPKSFLQNKSEVYTAGLPCRGC